jgi:glycosyltransferase involved in cell wall biosynthesis
MTRKILIVGTVRNVARTLARDIARIDSALSEDFERSYFFVESDSSDRTLEELYQLQKVYKDVTFVTLGKLQDKIPERIERIRYCRQQYVLKIRDCQPSEKWDYVLVCDLDGINNILKSNYIQSCFISPPPWSACFPVQTHGYYDLYALRHSVWMPHNIFTYVKQFESQVVKEIGGTTKLFASFREYLAIDKIKRNHFYSKMLKLQNRPEWIRVESAFGGLGLYVAESFMTHDYTCLNLEKEVYSEHIDLHASMIQDGSELYINPQFLNSSWNSYSLNRHFVFRLYRRLGWKLRG